VDKLVELLVHLPPVSPRAEAKYSTVSSRQDILPWLRQGTLPW
jgi:hypothetical protein